MLSEFTSVNRIVFGPGSFADLGRYAQELGRRCLIVTGASGRHLSRVRELLNQQEIKSHSFPVAGEPTLDTVSQGKEVAGDFEADLVIGIGGGSAIDTAKAIAGFLTNPGDPLDYLEVLGRGLPLTRPARPWIAVPTTAGTGAEVTKNAVLGVAGQGVKVSLRSPRLFASVALIDPELTLGLPPALTASTGMDALTQLIEAYVCSRANPLTDALCAAGIPRAARSLPICVEQPGNLPARTDLALASFWSGQALANAGLGAVHGLAGPIGGRYGASHGTVCAALLAPVMAANLAALASQAADHPARERYAQVARWLTGRPDANAEDGVTWVQALTRQLGIVPLSTHGIPPEDFLKIARAGLRASSMKANPVALTEDDLVAVLGRAG